MSLVELAGLAIMAVILAAAWGVIIWAVFTCPAKRFANSKSEPFNHG